MALHSTNQCAKCGSSEHPTNNCPREFSSNKCNHCGETSHSSDDCPYGMWDEECSNCGSKNHHTQDCPQDSRGSHRHSPSRTWRDRSKAAAKIIGAIIAIGALVFTIVWLVFIRSSNVNYPTHNPLDPSNTGGGTTIPTSTSCNTSTITGHITGNSVRVRSTPDANSTANILFKVDKVDAFYYLSQTVNGNGETWYQICVAGKIGWVSSQFATLHQPGTTDIEQLILDIRAEYQRITALKIPEQTFDFECTMGDPYTGTVTYFLENNSVVKILIDWGWLGDAYKSTEYYFQNGKYIFGFETEMVAVINMPEQSTETRTYVHNDQTIRMRYNKDITNFTPKRFGPTDREYKILNAYQTKAFSQALCDPSNVPGTSQTSSNATKDVALKPTISNPTTSPAPPTTATIPGMFPEASQRYLTPAELKKHRKSDLKFMRNEIYARYGYIFKTADMKSYFATQSWYHPQFDDVSSQLTHIEQTNVALIKKFE